MTPPVFTFRGPNLIVVLDGVRTTWRLGSEAAAIDKAAEIETDWKQTQAAIEAEGLLLAAQGADVTLPHPTEVGITDAVVAPDGEVDQATAARIREALAAQLEAPAEPTSWPATVTGGSSAVTITEATITIPAPAVPEPVVAPVEAVALPVEVALEWRPETSQMVMNLNVTTGDQPVRVWRSMGGRTTDFTVEPGKPANRWVKGQPGELFQLRIDGPDGAVIAEQTIPGAPDPAAPAGEGPTEG